MWGHSCRWIVCHSLWNIYRGVYTSIHRSALPRVDWHWKWFNIGYCYERKGWTGPRKNKSGLFILFPWNPFPQTKDSVYWMMRIIHWSQILNETYVNGLLSKQKRWLKWDEVKSEWKARSSCKCIKRQSNEPFHLYKLTSSFMLWWSGRFNDPSGLPHNEPVGDCQRPQPISLIWQLKFMHFTLISWDYLKLHNKK